LFDRAAAAAGIAPRLKRVPYESAEEKAIRSTSSSYFRESKCFIWMIFQTWKEQSQFLEHASQPWKHFHGTPPILESRGLAHKRGEDQIF
jgi:hypothetical protein